MELKEMEINYKRKTSASFLSALGSSRLWMFRRIEKLKTIQQDDPGFNYANNNTLQQELDLLEKSIKQLKQTGARNG